MGVIFLRDKRGLRTQSRTAFEKHLPGAFLETPFGTKKGVGPTHFKWCLVVTKHQNYISFGKRGTHHVAKRVLSREDLPVQNRVILPTRLWYCSVGLGIWYRSYLTKNKIV